MAATWSSQIRDAFASSSLCGAYNKLLSTLFPVDTDFCVVPQTNAFEIQYHSKPVLLADVSPREDLATKSKRTEKDRMMRERLSDLAGTESAFLEILLDTIVYIRILPQLLPDWYQCFWDGSVRILPDEFSHSLHNSCRRASGRRLLGRCGPHIPVEYRHYFAYR